MEFLKINCTRITISNRFLITFLFFLSSSPCIFLTTIDAHNKHQKHNNNNNNKGNYIMHHHQHHTSGHHQHQSSSLTADEEAFLAAHNKVRLHSGEPPFVWDPKLASYAREYAQKRKQDCGLVHSHGPYGENIFWGAGNRWAASDAVRLWVKEHRYYDRAKMSCRPGKVCGHYTQIVWRNSQKLGCAWVECFNADRFAVCSYDPPGNYVGDNPFLS